MSIFGNSILAIPFNATAAQLQALMLASSVFNGSGVVVTGGPWPAVPLVCTFSGNLSASFTAAMTFDNTLLTGGASPAATAVRTTLAGRSGRRYVAIDIPGAWENPDTDQTDANTRVYASTFNYVFDPTNAFGIQFRLQNGRTAAYV